MKETENALAIIEKHKNDLVFVKREELNTQSVFIPEVTIIDAKPDDFHFLNGKYMPKSHHASKISTAAGIDFIAQNCGTRKEGDYCYVGFAQGRRRLPDGQWQLSSVCEYEFDAQDRAEEDFLKDMEKPPKDQKYMTEAKKRAHVLELKRFGRARANTGARLRVIRELIAMPISFPKEDIARAMIFLRIAVNTDKMLETPGMAGRVIQHALGAADTVYGEDPERNITPEPLQIEEAPEDELGITIEEPDIVEDPPLTEKEFLKMKLREFIERNEFSDVSKDTMRAIESNESSTLEALRDMVTRAEKYLEKRKQKGEQNENSTHR